MKFNRFFIFFFAFMGLMACSSNNDIEEDTPTTKEKKFLPLTVEVHENPMVDSNAAQSNMRKAPIIDNTSFDAFYLNYYYQGVEDLAYNGTPWPTTRVGSGRWRVGEENQQSGGGDYGWPTDYGDGQNPDVNWFADNTENGNGFDFNDGDPYINFSVDEYSTNHKDLLVANITEKWTDHQGVMSLTFNHKCAALQFYVKKANNIKSKAVTIHSVELHNLANQGRYNYDTDNWSNLTGTNSKYTLLSSSGAIAFEADKEYTENDYVELYAGDLQSNAKNDYLFMIPQTVEAWSPSTNPNGAYLLMSCKIDGDDKVVYVPFSATLKQGVKYNVYINLGKSTMLNQEGAKIFN